VPGGWKGSTRSARLPRDWPQRRAAVWRRDGDRCWWCGGPGADEIDHKQRGDDHRLENLGPIHQDVAPYCHRKKSSAEGNQQRWQYRMAREPERHPGLR
jgi:5-methylcytosine-specific restriction protein A